MSPMNNRLLVPRKTPGLLDLVPGAAAAYSLRSLSNSYADPVVTVRRSSDDAEDSFTAAEVADGTLAAFAGAGDAFVKQWWDQSGNARHASQTTPGYQPKIVSSGVVILEEGKPAIEFDGTDDRLSFSDIATDSPMTGFSVTLRQAAGKRSVVVCNEATKSGTLLGYEYTDEKTYASNRDGYIVASSATASQVMYTLISADSSDRSSLSLYRNGALLAVSSASLPNTLPLNSIGKRSTEFQTGTAQEFVIYRSDLTAQRELIEGNIAWGWSV